MKNLISGKLQEGNGWGALGALAWGTCLAAALTACGGGDTAGTTTPSNPPTALSTAGTVNGFGSVYVDGAEIEDANASVTMERADGSLQNVPLRMGQRVRVKHDGANKASSITVDAAVIGQVAALNTTAKTLTVAGQTVSTNSDSTSTAPLTVYGGGYDQFSDMAQGDIVMVFGTPVYSASDKKYGVQASRIEKSDKSQGERLMGTVNSVAGSTSFVLGNVTVNYGTATVVPSGTTIAANQSVVLWGATGAYSGGTFTATRVRVLNGTLPDGVTSGTLRVSGVASAYDATAKTLSVQGVTVNLSSATVTPASSTLGNNSYVDVSGTVNVDGTLTASTVKIRQVNVTSASIKVLLNGTIDSLNDQNSFVVRGVPVDASAITATNRVCSVNLAVGTPVYVEAVAQTDTNVVLASRIQCQNSSSSSDNLVIRSVTGTVSNVSATNSTFTLTSTSTSGSSSTSTVRWTSQTAFTGGLTAANLATTTGTVRVRGYLDSSGVLVAREVHVVGTDADDVWQSGSSDTSNASNARGWNKYRAKH